MLTSAGTTGRRERDAARAGERERERDARCRRVRRLAGFPERTDGAARTAPRGTTGGHARARGSSPAPWPVPLALDLDLRPGAGSYHVDLDADLDEDLDAMRAEGTRALRVAARLHLAGSSVGRSGVGVRPRADVDGSARMSPGDLAEWRRAATLSERASPGSFWDAVTVVAAEMAREMDEQWREERRERRDAGARDGVPERPHPLAVAARRNEVVWELIFVAARGVTRGRARDGTRERRVVERVGGARCPPRWRRRPSRRRRTAARARPPRPSS